MSERVVALTQTGLGRTEGGTFVPRVLPDEVVAVEGSDVRILTPSPLRVKPPCRHFRACGGCALQHATDGFVTEWKAEVVARALAAHGLETAFRPQHISPPMSRRRARFAGKRTKSGAMVGFHARASNVLVENPDCHILVPDILAARPMLEALTVLAASRKAEIALTVTQSEAGLDVLVESATELTSQLRIDLATFAQRHDLARLTWGDEPVVTLRAPVQRFGTATVVPPPGAFLQATKDAEVAMRDDVIEIVGSAKNVVDLFAGCGTFSLPLAETAQVHPVEGDAAMIAALDAGWRGAAGLKRVTSETRDLFRRPLLADELSRYDAAVIDPPRAGAEAQVAEIAASRLQKVAMVSCNPVTFARDAARLVAVGFTLDWLRVVDQFRWSAHVEVVASFTRR